MDAVLSEKTTIALLASIPTLERDGLAIAEALYARLLSNAELRALFNLSDQRVLRQPRALALALLNFAKFVDDPVKCASFLRALLKNT